MSVKTEFDAIRKPLEDYRDHLAGFKGYLVARNEWDEIKQQATDQYEREIGTALDSIRVLELAFEIARQP